MAEAPPTKRTVKHFHLPFEKRKGFSYSHEEIERLSEYEKYQLSFHPERPRYLDYLQAFDEPEACLCDHRFGSCTIQVHRASMQIEGKALPVMLIGQQSAPTSDFAELQRLMQDPAEIARWNQGMPTPAAFEKAIAAIAMAEEEGRTLITIIDTAGADPTEASESEGIAWKIGRCMQLLGESKVPTLSVIINRGCSGGAIALTGCDRVLAMEYATYLVISPEACSSILFRTRNKADVAAEISRITAREALEYGNVDRLIEEPEGPAHRFPRSAVASFAKAVAEELALLSALPPDKLFEHRLARWEKVGVWEEMEEAGIEAVSRQRSGMVPPPASNGFMARHKGCRNEAGRAVADPVLYARLAADNFVCATCGYHYQRLTAQDWIGVLADPGSFIEHADTRRIVDSDLLGFPGYAEKLLSARKRSGTATAVVTGNAEIGTIPVVLCATNFSFLGGSFAMSTGEKLFRAAMTAIREKRPMVVHATGGGARMHEGCSSMVSIPKVHVALSALERAGLPLVSIITDPTLGGVAIGVGSRGTRLFEYHAGNIGFSGKRVIEQYTGKATSSEFQTVGWLQSRGFATFTARPQEMKAAVIAAIGNREP